MKNSTWIVMALVFAAALSGCGREWSSASRDSAGLAPHPHSAREAVVQAYAASVWGWRGWFADHTWVAAKPAGAEHYTVYEVIGWRVRRGGSALRIARDIPDRRWFGAEPRVLADVRGDIAERVVARLDAVARSYPYPNEYRAFPGPNSNTFTAWVAREIPELNLDLPMRAIGKSYPLERENP